MKDVSQEPLLTDLYQLTMLQAYLKSGMRQTAAFEFYVRNLPPSRAFLMACGLENCLDYLENLRFDDDDLRYLESTRRFSDDVLEYLKTFRFTGDVWAMPEGTIFFANEPVLSVVAPICEAQFVETRLINILQYQILVASKAARCVMAAGDKVKLIDFGVRRAHGAEAGLFAARASFIAGFIGTSTVLAEALWGIPAFGTMAHSFIEAHAEEKDAFIDFCLANPRNTTLLLDTYDTIEGAKKALHAARELTARGIPITRVRLDSGDILKLSREVRKILDENGRSDIGIIATGNMDEFSIRDLMSRGAPIDSFGVGTKLDTSDDAPYLECAYKLVEYAGEPKLKNSPQKQTLPGRKQVFRRFQNKTMVGDTICLKSAQMEGLSLLKKVMKDGRSVGPHLSLTDIACYAKNQIDSLPENLRSLQERVTYPVDIDPDLLTLQAQMNVRRKLREDVERCGPGTTPL